MSITGKMLPAALGLSATASIMVLGAIPSPVAIGSDESRVSLITAVENHDVETTSTISNASFFEENSNMHSSVLDWWHY